MLENSIAIGGGDLRNVGYLYCNRVSPQCWRILLQSGGISAMLENYIVIGDLWDVETGIDEFS